MALAMDSCYDYCTSYPTPQALNITKVWVTHTTFCRQSSLNDRNIQVVYDGHSEAAKRRNHTIIDGPIPPQAQLLPERPVWNAGYLTHVQLRGLARTRIFKPLELGFRPLLPAGDPIEVIWAAPMAKQVRQILMHYGQNLAPECSRYK